MINRATAARAVHAATAAVLLVATPAACTTQAETRSAVPSEATRRFEFGVFGDAPYDADEEARVRRVIEQMNAADLAFVVHVGDLEAGASGSYQRGVPTCTEASLARRREIFAGVRHPFIFTPGDNDWTDCHSVPGASLDPLERLAKLRATFFGDDETSGGGRLSFTTQPRYIENRQWLHEGVLFATLHIVGTNNNRGRTPAMDREYAERNAAALAWLSQAFRRARQEDAPALVLFMHANPRFEGTWDDVQASRYMLGSSQRDVGAAHLNGYDEFLEALRTGVLAFARPVLLVHGDTHTFRIDKPLAMRAGSRVVEQFTRLETFGSPDVAWIRIGVDPGRPGVFSFSPEAMAGAGTGR